MEINRTGRRECDNCVKESVGKMVGSFGYQKWLVRILVVSIVLGGVFNFWATASMSTTNTTQSIDIANNRQNIGHITDHMERQTTRLDRLISLAETRNERLIKLESTK